MKFAVLILALLMAYQASAQVIVISNASIEPPKLPAIVEPPIVEKPKPRPKATFRPPRMRSIDVQLLDAHNAARARYGLHPYRLNAKLNYVALHCADWNARHSSQRFIMQRHTPNGLNPWQRIRAAGYDYATLDHAQENVAVFEFDTDAVFATNAWLNSRVGHRDNVLSPVFTEAGFGAVRGPTGAWAYCAAYGRPRTHL